MTDALDIHSKTERKINENRTAKYAETKANLKKQRQAENTGPWRYQDHVLLVKKKTGIRYSQRALEVQVTGTGKKKRFFAFFTGEKR